MSVLKSKFSIGYVVALVLLLMSPAAYATLPLLCEINLGPWCILRGLENIEFSTTANSNHFRWNIYDSDVKEEGGVVLEGLDCRTATADQIEVLENGVVIEWQGRKWSRWTVSLNTRGACELQILFPMRNGIVLEWAAYSIPSHIAICMENRKCTEKILAPDFIDGNTVKNGPTH